MNRSIICREFPKRATNRTAAPAAAILRAALTGTILFLAMFAIASAALACTGLTRPMPASILEGEDSAIGKVREGFYRWPSARLSAEEALAGPRASTEPVLAILYKFKDTANPLGTSTEQGWSDRFFGDSVSVADYWSEVSYGSLTMTKAAETSGTNDNGVAGWYTSANNFSAYLDAYGDVKWRDIVYDAIVASDANVNYANFDTDGDGYVADDELHIVVIAAAYEGSYWDFSPWVWRSNWFFKAAKVPNLDGTQVALEGHGTAALAGERYYKGNSTPSVVSEFGIIAHEIGHQLGLPDLYDTDASSLCYGGKGQGAGYWDLMASGDWLPKSGGGEPGHYPAHISAWSKAYRGWIIPTEVTNDVTGVQVSRIEDNAVAYKLWTAGQYGGDYEEYFMVENRQRTGYDRRLPGCGLLIYHIDESVKDDDADSDNISNWNDNDLQWDATHEFLDVETADGFTRNADGSACNLGCPNCARDDLDVYTWNVAGCPNAPRFDNRGDSTDPWYSGHKTTFNKNSCPSSKDYNGNDSSVEVKNVSGCADPMTADLIVGAPNANAPDVWLKDCAADDGSEPDDDCPGAWWTSPDIWIDNNRDGTQDAPAEGKQNRFFVGVRNRGLGPAVNVTVNLYHELNSVGLTFPTGATWDAVKVIGLIPVGGAVRTEVLATIPPPPNNGWHYCFGATLDTQRDPLSVNAGMVASNSKACVNIIQLWGRAGHAIPADFTVQNPDDDSSPGGGFFNVTVSHDLPAGWTVLFQPGVPLPVWLEKGQMAPMHIVITPPAGDWHGPVGTIHVEEYREDYPYGITGGIEFLVIQDNRPPAPISDLSAEATTDSTRAEDPPSAAIRLSWSPVAVDVQGTVEWIEDYEVHRSDIEDFVPGPATFIGFASVDEEPGLPGFQHLDHDPGLDPRTVYYYRVIPMDQTGWMGAPSNLAEAVIQPILATADLDVGDLICSVTDRGIIGFTDGTQAEGQGFVYPKGTANRLFIGSLWVGRSPEEIANRDYDADPEREWRRAEAPDGRLVEEDGPADQGFAGAFVDSAASATMSLLVCQESYAWATAGHDRYVLLRYRIENRGEDALHDLYAGLFCDWDIGADATTNAGAVDPTRDLVYVVDEAEAVWMGMRLLRGPATPPVANATLIDNPTYVWPDAYVPDADKYLFLAAGDSAHVLDESPHPDDYSALVSAGPFTLVPGGTREIVFAIVAGRSLAELQATADAAAGRYPFDPADAGDAVSMVAPGSLRLDAARPNPFGAYTTISLALGSAGRIDLAVFDVSGRKVRQLADGELASGHHILRWDGRDAAGHPLPGGVYFCRVRGAAEERSVRLLLIR